MRMTCLSACLLASLINIGCGNIAEIANPSGSGKAVASASETAAVLDPAAPDTSAGGTARSVVRAPADSFNVAPAGAGGELSLITGGYYLSGPQAFYIYEPTGVSSAPVIAFFHGYNTLDPNQYGGWIKRLVAARYTVIFPVYQDYLTIDTQFTPNALNAVKNAYNILAQPGHVAPASGKFAIIAHSIGCVVGINVGALAPSNGLPAPRVILMANPGDANSFYSLPSIMLSSYSAISSTARFVALTGDLDNVVGNQVAIDLYNKLPQIPVAQKNVIEFFSDYYGLPPIVAQHGSCLAIDPNFVADQPAPKPLNAGALEWLAGMGDAIDVAFADLAANEDSSLSSLDTGDGGSEPQARIPFQSPGGPISSTIDTMDYKGYWFIGDSMLNWAFNGAAWSLPPGGPPKTMSMGTWSDGVPVKPAQILLP